MITGFLFTGWQHLMTKSLIALVILASLPAAGWAEVLLFRNDTKAVLVVQGACVTNGKLKAINPSWFNPAAWLA